VNPNRAFLPRVMIRGERPHRAGHSGTVMTLLKAVLKAALRPQAPSGAEMQTHRRCLRRG
jgi:hypothetical protein